MTELEEIYLATIGCVSKCEACLSVKRLMKERWAENRLADMYLWALSMGALERPEASLDRRLRFYAKTRTVLINFLLILQYFIDSCRMQALNETSGGIDSSNNKREPDDSPVSLVEDTVESTLGDNLELAPSSATWFIVVASALGLIPLPIQRKETSRMNNILQLSGNL